LETPTSRHWPLGSRHRHLVAFPVFIAALVISFTDIHTDLPDVLGSVSHLFGTIEDKRFTFDSGVYGVVYAGGELYEEGNHLVLAEGSALLASKGIVHVVVNDTSLSLINGAAHITQGTHGVTIAALTSPVVIFSGDQREIIPVGMQWELSENGIAPINDGFEAWMQARLPTLLPMSFIERKLGDLSIVRQPENILPEAVPYVSTDFVPEEQVLLQVSESHVQQGKHEEILGVVRFAVEAQDTDRLEELLSQPSVVEALATDRGAAVTLALLSTSDQSQTALRMLLLGLQISKEDVWLLSSFHPALRDIAWVLPEPDVSTESHVSRIFLLPFSAFSPETFSDFVFERFSVSLREMLGTVGDADAFGAHFVQAHLPLIQKLEDRGYPLRAQFLSQILLDLIKEMTSPSEDIEKAKEYLLQRDRINIAPLPPKKEPRPIEEVVAPEPESEPEVTLSTEEVEAKAYQLLEDAGALFTINSAISAYDGNKARVMDVLFSTETEDRAVSFTLDVVLLNVSNIEINGNTDFLYTPSFDGFVQWIRK